MKTGLRLDNTSDAIASFDDPIAHALQVSEALGIKVGSSPDLSFLNSPDPFAVTGIEVRRGNDRNEKYRLGHATAQHAASSQTSGAASGRAMQANLPVSPTPDITQLLKTLLMKLVTSLQNISGTGQPDIQGIAGGIGTTAGYVASVLRAVCPEADAYHAILHETQSRTGQVSTAEMVKILDDNSATVFDARTQMEYAIGHLPGAVSLAAKPGAPRSQHVSDVAEIARIVPDRSAPIILYCNGPYCGKSRRLGEELINAGYTNVRRYQLGTPAWRALVGPMEIEREGIRYVKRDPTSVFLDGRSSGAFAAGSLDGARNVPIDQIGAAKGDGRLPMDDFNTRVVTFGGTDGEALALAEALAHTGFNNVKFFGGTFADILAAIH